jgi:glucokinase
VRGEHVAAAALAGDDGALAVVDTFAHWVAVGLAALVTVLDTGRVVIGGGLVDLGDVLLVPVRRHLQPLVMGAAHRPPAEVVAAALGPEAGAVGAAIAAADRTVGGA